MQWKAAQISYFISFYYSRTTGKLFVHLQQAGIIYIPIYNTSAKWLRFWRLSRKTKCLAYIHTLGEILCCLLILSRSKKLEWCFHCYIVCVFVLHLALGKANTYFLCHRIYLMGKVSYFFSCLWTAIVIEELLSEVALRSPVYVFLSQTLSQIHAIKISGNSSWTISFKVFTLNDSGTHLLGLSKWFTKIAACFLLWTEIASV